MSVLLLNKPPLNEALLVHYGVKGQKWGVRRNRTTDKLNSIERSEAKKTLKSNQKELSDRIFERRWRGKGGIGELPYNELKNEDRTIAAGAEFFRVTSRKNEQFRDKTFVSTNAKDRNNYKAVIPALTGRGGKKSYKIHYEKTLELTQDLKLPSEKARIDAFNTIMNSKSVEIKGTFGRTKVITGREYLKRQGYGKKVLSVDTAVLGKDHFERMNQTATFKTPLNSAYFSQLRSKGYNALQDDNDRGILADDPIILLNPNNTVKQTSIRQLTARDINDAQKNFEIAEEVSNGRTR